MSYSVNFLDNQVVTAEAVNQITEELGGGALGFSDDMLYGVDELNQISESLIQKGVSRGCGLSASDGVVTVSPGVLFMPDGKRVEIDAEGLSLSYVPGVTNYVWFYQDDTLGFAAPRCTDFAPGSAAHVMLGIITPEGTVSGYPDLAVMKHANMGLNHTESHSLVVDFSGETEETLMQEILLSKVGTRFLLAYGGETSSSLAYRDNVFSGHVDLSSGACFGVLSTTPDLAGDPDWATVSGSESEGTLTVALCNYKYALTHYKVKLRFELGTDNVLRIYKSFERTGRGGAENLRESITLTLILC